jgi:hypothetical protein
MIFFRSRCANFNYYDEKVDNYINSDFDEYALDETQNERVLRQNVVSHNVYVTKRNCY